LKYLLREKSNLNLQDDLIKSKRALDEKHYELVRLNEDSTNKAEHNQDLRGSLHDLEKELESLKY